MHEQVIVLTSDISQLPLAVVHVKQRSVYTSGVDADQYLTAGQYLTIRTSMHHGVRLQKKV